MFHTISSTMLFPEKYLDPLPPPHRRLFGLHPTPSEIPVWLRAFSFFCHPPSPGDFHWYGYFAELDNDMYCSGEFAPKLHVTINNQNTQRCINFLQNSKIYIAGSFQLCYTCVHIFSFPNLNLFKCSCVIGLKCRFAIDKPPLWAL